MSCTKTKNKMRLEKTIRIISVEIQSHLEKDIYDCDTEAEIFEDLFMANGQIIYESDVKTKNSLDYSTPPEDNGTEKIIFEIDNLTVYNTKGDELPNVSEYIYNNLKKETWEQTNTY